MDLDVVARLRLLDFFRQECEERGATILYATHIFDGLEDWVTHMAYLEEGEMVRGGPVESVPDVATVRQGGGKLLNVVEKWLRVELARRQEAAAKHEALHGPRSLEASVQPNRTPLNMPNKHLAFFR